MYTYKKYQLLALALLLFSAPSFCLENNWKLDSRFASLNMIEMVKNNYPSLSNKAELISHYSGYYSINPFLLSESLLQGNRDVKAQAQTLSALVDKNKLSLSKYTKPIIIERAFAAMQQNGIINKSKIATSENQPVFDLPFDHNSEWFFGGVHTWTGEDNGQPMSSIDIASNWSQVWGSNTDNDWVSAAHDGVISVFSSCFVRITHESGWATDYYHLDNVQYSNGDEIKAGDLIANYADNLSQAICQGGHSSGPHVHFALVKNGTRFALDGQALSKWVIHSGDSSYDFAPSRMWLYKGDEKKFAFRDPIAHLQGDNEIDYRYTGVYSSADISGHGVNITITQIKNDNSVVRNIIFIAFYTYDDDGNANFYAGNIDYDNWRTDETKTVELIQTSGGNFTNMQAIDFDSGVVNAGTMDLHFIDCSTVEIGFSLLEPTTNEIVSQELVLTKTVGTPNHVCNAPSIQIN